MLRSAVRGAAGTWLAAIAGLAALALSACGDGSAGKTANANQPASSTGDAASSGATQRAGDNTAATVAASTAPLDTTGWVLPPPFYAAGDEPFWRLDIVDGWFSFKRSGLPVIEAPMVQPTRVGGADVFDASPLKVKIKREACETDEGGKADITALVTFDGTDFDGCAFSGTSVAVSASAEAATVVESVKIIDACLGKLGDPALVTAVYPREEGKTAVALRSKDGSLYECAVESDGSTIAFLDPVEDRSAGPWMNKMRFLRKGTADNTKCDGAEEVRAGDKVLGRMLAKACKF